MLKRASLERSRWENASTNKLRQYTRNLQIENDIQATDFDWGRSPSPATDISDAKKASQKKYSTKTCYDQLETNLNWSRHRKGWSTHHRSWLRYRFPIPPLYRREHPDPGLNVLLPLIGRYHNAVDNRFYRLICESPRQDDDRTSRMQKMRKNISIQMKEQAVNRKTRIRL